MAFQHASDFDSIVCNRKAALQIEDWTERSGDGVAKLQILEGR
jgi:hypothetical protein